MKAIFKKELRSFFLSMTGYALIAFLITFVGIYFMIYNIGYGYPYFAYTLSGVMLILLVLVPVITMRSFAEEKKNRTDQLLFTSPIKIRDIVLGKYAAMVSVFFVPNVVFCLFPLIIKTMGNSSLLSDYVSLMEFFLMGCAFIAIGMFFFFSDQEPDDSRSHNLRGDADPLHLGYSYRISSQLRIRQPGSADSDSHMRRLAAPSCK